MQCDPTTHSRRRANARSAIPVLGLITVARELIRWTALLAGIAFGLLLLNGAIFRAWVAGGPPNDNPVGWVFSAWNYVAWSASALLAGIGFFLLLRLSRTPKLAVFCLVISALLASVPWLREFVATDICLDSGGRWSSQELRCYHGPDEA